VDELVVWVDKYMLCCSEGGKLHCSRCQVSISDRRAEGCDADQYKQLSGHTFI